MSAKPRLAIVLPRFPFPLEKGDKLRAFHQIKELSSEFEIYLFSLHEDQLLDTSIAELLPYTQEIHNFHLSKWTLPFRLLFFTIVRSLPAQVAYFYSPVINAKIQRQLDRVKPDVIYNQLPRTIPYLVDRTESKVVDLMDAFSYGMSKRSINSTGIKKVLYRWESRMIRRYEAQAILSYQGVTMISAQDRVRSPHIKGQEVMIVANGIETSHLQSKPESRHSDIVFVGNMGYQPNIDAAIFLVNKILPAYQQQFDTQLSVVIAGARPSKEVKNLASDHVKVLGWVEDINDAYNTGRVFVAPIFYGMGQQNKLMEAIACELPCVVSPEVAAPFNARDHEELLIATSVDEFIYKIHDVLTNRINVTLLLDKALRNINHTHTWKQQTQPILQLLKDLATSPQSTD